MASELLSTIRSEIDARLNELRPSLAEYERLLVAAEALDQDDGAPLDTAPVPKPRATRARSAPRSHRSVSRRGSRGSAAGVISRVARPPAGAVSQPAHEEVEPSVAKPAKTPRAQRGAAREAILAALDHGSHTVGELVVVTAMSGPNLNGNLGRLVSEGIVVKTEREGKTAYALPSTG